MLSPGPPSLSLPSYSHYFPCDCWSQAPPLSRTHRSNVFLPRTGLWFSLITVLVSSFVGILRIGITLLAAESNRLPSRPCGLRAGISLRCWIFVPRFLLVSSMFFFDPFARRIGALAFAISPYGASARSDLIASLFIARLISFFSSPLPDTSSASQLTSSHHSVSGLSDNGTVLPRVFIWGFATSASCFSPSLLEKALHFHRVSFFFFQISSWCRTPQTKMWSREPAPPRRIHCKLFFDPTFGYNTVFRRFCKFGSRNFYGVRTSFSEEIGLLAHVDPLSFPWLVSAFFFPSSAFTRLEVGFFTYFRVSLPWSLR